MERSNETGSNDRAPLNVIVLDSDTRSLELTARHIEHRIPRATVFRALSPIDARSCAEKRKVDFIVFACDGSPEAWSQPVKELYLLYPGARLILTGCSTPPADDRSGILGILGRPYRIDDLIALIESARQPGSNVKTHSE